MKVWNFEGTETKPKYYLKFQMGTSHGADTGTLFLVITDCDGVALWNGHILSINGEGKLKLMGGIDAEGAKGVGIKLDSAGSIVIA